MQCLVYCVYLIWILQSKLTLIHGSTNMYNSTNQYILKIHVRRVVGRGYSEFHLYMCVFIYLFVSRLLAKRKTIQTRNLAHMLPLTSSKSVLFCFFEKISVTAASLEKLPCHVDFTHISSITMFLSIIMTLLNN